MKRLIFFIAVVFSIPATGSTSKKRIISLKEAQEYAVKQNYGIQALKEEVNVHDAELRSNRSNFFPKFGVVAGREYNQSKSTTEESNQLYLYGNINLFNGFEDQSNSKRSKMLKDVSESEYRNGVHRLKLQVEELYYTYLYKKEVLKHIEEAIKLNTNHLGNVRRRSQSGMASTADLMDFRLRESFLLSQTASIKQDLLETKLNLVRLMGPELDTNFEPQGALPHHHVEGNLNDYLDRVSDRTENLKQSILKTGAAISELRSERSKWLPSIDLEVQAGAIPLDDRVDPDSNNNFNALLSAKWEFFSGFKTSAKIQKAKAHLRQRELEQKQTLLDSMANIETGFRKLQSIQERVDLERKNEAYAQKLYKTTLSEYRRGVKNSGDLKEASELLLESKINKSSFDYEFLVTKIEIEKLYNINFDLSLKD